MIRGYTTVKFTIACYRVLSHAYDEYNVKLYLTESVSVLSILCILHIVVFPLSQLHRAVHKVIPHQSVFSSVDTKIANRKNIRTDRSG